MTKKMVDTIETTSIITIEISGAYYEKLKTVVLHMGNENPEAFVKCIEKIKTQQQVENLYEFTLLTLFEIVSEIELRAKEQGKIKEEELDIPDVPETT
jgi:hypothetical protein